MKFTVGDIQAKDIIKYCAATAAFSLSLVHGVWLETSGQASTYTMTVALIIVSLFITSGAIYRIFFAPRKEHNVFNTYVVLLVFVLWMLSCGTLIHAINTNVFEIYPSFYHAFSLLGLPAAIYFSVHYGTQQRSTWNKIQMVSEGILIGVAISLVLWLTVFEPLGIRLQNNLLGFGIIILTLMSCSLQVQVVVMKFNYFICTAVGAYVLWSAILIVSMVDTIRVGFISYNHIVPLYLMVGTCLGLFCFSVNFEQEHHIEENDTASRTRQNILTMLVVFTTVMFCLSFIYQYAHFFDFSVLSLLLTAAIFAQEVIRSKVNNDMMSTVHTQASEDDLTKLPNRRKFGFALAELINHPTRHYLLLVNIDRFGEMNGLVGHEDGDQILCRFAHELRLMDKMYDSVSYRLGADEFVTICAGASTQAEAIASTIQRSITRCNDGISGLIGFPMTVSIGISRINRGVGTAATAKAEIEDAREQSIAEFLERETNSSLIFKPLVQATYALRQGRANDNKIQWYTSELAKDQHRRQEIEGRLSKAIANVDLNFNFQPVIDIKSGKTVGFEALARWIDPELGFVSPADFIPIAERLGLVGNIGELALKSTLNVIRDAQERGITLSGAVNISPIHLRKPNMHKFILDECSRAGIDRERVVLEVTEGVFMDSNDPAIGTIFELHKRGFKISLDDFGSGYSSWGYLSRLPVDVIKVDRSLTQRTNDPSVHVVVRSILSMCADLGFETVIEGIEEAEELRIFNELNADTGQGWFWSKALPHDDFIEFVCKNNPVEATI